MYTDDLKVSMFVASCYTILKVAEYSATLENYEKAIKIYEQVAAASLENQLLKYAAKDQFFRASICHLCIDSLNAQHAVKKYEEQYPAFGDSREAKLVKVNDSKRRRLLRFSPSYFCVYFSFHRFSRNRKYIYKLKPLSLS